MFYEHNRYGDVFRRKVGPNLIQIEELTIANEIATESIQWMTMY